MRERDVESYLVQRVRRHGGKAIKLAPTEAGIPDRLILWPGGRLHLVEVKTDHGRVSTIQERWHNHVLTQQGVIVRTLFGRGDVDDYIEEMDNGTQGP